MEEYREYIRRKVIFSLLLTGALIFTFPFALGVGSYKLTFSQIWKAFFNHDGAAGMIVWNIRLPRVLTSIFVGASLAISGAVMQTLLKNPLASPFTMGISHGAMFGASLAILLFSGSEESTGRIMVENPYFIVLFAFTGSIIGVFIILSLARLKGLSPEAVILSGVAISSFFMAGTTLLHYFADELQLAAMVYWSFGDLGRTAWNELFLVIISFGIIFSYFVFKSWDLNAIEVDESVAKSLGIDTTKLRFFGIILASLIASITVAFVGVIGFIGLICPHMIRLIIGSDHRFLIPASALLGALILMVSDMFSKIILSPTVIPVGIITSFIGVPLFIYLLLRMEVRR
ncbi:MAG: iron complex transport system permease protein [Thermotogaceae bacterium]|nr:iron complex transport system permease protein [Thermotogaceae bacterium]